MKSTNLKNVKPETLPSDPIRFQSKSQESSRSSENSNPNVTPPKLSGSLLVKSAQNTPKLKHNPTQAVSDRIRERRFMMMKKDSEEELFNTRREPEVELGESSNHNVEEVEVGESDEIWASEMKRKREKVLEEARRNLPEHGKVMHLVRAFEKLTCFPLSKPTYKDEKTKKALKWALPGMSQRHPKCPKPETDQATWSCSSFSPASVSSSCDNIVSILNSNASRRSISSSLDSSASMGIRRLKKKQIKATSLKPFNLRTEERARAKKEEFSKKLQEMIMEEEKMRIPIAQGLPWTTNEPESLVKPHVKDITIPVDLKLHSDIRAVERAEFDYKFAEKINQSEQMKAERKRLQKVAEEEELRRLRKELIPKAQPMPYFDRPFVPKKSNKHPTIPRDPKFNIPQHKKKRCCSTSPSMYETGSCTSDLLYQQDL